MTKKKEDPERFMTRVRVEVLEALYPDIDTRPEYAKEELAKLKSKLIVDKDKNIASQIPQEVISAMYGAYKQWAENEILKARKLKFKKMKLPLPDTGNILLNETLTRTLMKDIGKTYQLETGADGVTTIVLGG